MFFDKLKKAIEGGNKGFAKEELKELNKTNQIQMTSAPAFDYIHIEQNRDVVKDSDCKYIVLSWISKKKKGYDLSSNKYPKWFSEKYGIDFNVVAKEFIKQGLLLTDVNNVIISEQGKEALKEHSYVIFFHEHPQYGLSLNDFRSSPNLGKVQDSDLAWGVFNKRIITYSQNLQWSSLAVNYANMADLLVEEKRYKQALDFVFATAYIETSGMRDDNELTPISEEFKGNGNQKATLANGMPDIFSLEINNYLVTAPFLKIQEALSLGWDDIKKGFLSCSFIINLEKGLPFKYFEKEESYEIFKEAMIAGGKKSIFPLKNVKKKLKVNIPDEHSNKYFYASAENKVNRIYGH